MNVYYNDNDPYCTAWLRNLIDAGHLPDGDIDDRDIKEIDPNDLKGYDQCHFFAGIGGWPLALTLAGWEGPAWTGSCPCQPFSSAGQRKGENDPRHLWPAFQSLIAECRPPTIFGEQVASPLGRQWLSGVRADLEDLGYAVGAADLCAAGVGAPHIRQRLWWVANAQAARSPYRGAGSIQSKLGTSNGELNRLAVFDGGDAGAEGIQRGGKHGQQPQDDRIDSGLGDTEGDGRHGRTDDGDQGRRQRASESPGTDSGVGDAEQRRLQSRGKRSARANAEVAATRCKSSSFWSDFDLIPCADGKARRVEPGTFPLAHGVPARVGKLRAYGNAIVPQVAAEFVMAYMDMEGG